MADSIDTVIRTMAARVEVLYDRSERTNEHLSNIDQRLTTQNGRLDKLESWRDKFTGELRGVSKVLVICSVLLSSILAVAKLTGWEW